MSSKTIRSLLEYYALHEHFVFMIINPRNGIGAWFVVCGQMERWRRPSSIDGGFITWWINPLLSQTLTCIDLRRRSHRLAGVSMVG